jgi:hypothetical protein
VRWSPAKEGSTAAPEVQKLPGQKSFKSKTIRFFF